MFFENEWISFEILDVIKLERRKEHFYTNARNFNALSFRFTANTTLKTNQKEYHLGNNSIVFVPAACNYDRISEHEELIAVHFNITNHYTKEIEFFASENSEKLKKLFKEILVCWNQKEVGYKYKCSGIFCEILSLCYAQNQKDTTQKSKIENSVKFILKHFNNPDLTLKEIADQSFISEVYFRKLFKKEFGTSPQKYIINLRIQKATEFISTGYYSLKEIASMCGYTDYKYFSTEFKKQMGVPPSKYKYIF